MGLLGVGTVDGWVQQWEGRPEDRAKNLRAYLWTRFHQATEANTSLQSQAQEEEQWMAASDHALIEQTLSDYIQALKCQQEAEAAKRKQQEQEQIRIQQEAERRYIEQQEAERGANSLVGKISQLFAK